MVIKTALYVVGFSLILIAFCVAWAAVGDAGHAARDLFVTGVFGVPGGLCLMQASNR